MATLIVDGHYLLHRAMHVPQLRILSTKDGKPTGGTFGALKSIASTLIRIPEIREAIMVFDGGRSKRRMSIYPEYKAHRKRNEEVDPDGIPYHVKFRMQYNYLKFILPRLGVRVVVLPGKEGDDLVGLLARNHKSHLKIVASDDKDMLQLVETGVHVWRPLAEQMVSTENFQDVVGIDPRYWMLKKAILGDSSDNIKGVPGVGNRTVDSLLSDCVPGDYPFEGFFEHALEVSSKRSLAIVDSIDTVFRNFELIDISREKFTEEERDTALSLAAASSSLDVLTVKDMFTKLEFYSLIDDYPRWVSRFQMLR